MGGGGGCSSKFFAQTDVDTKERTKPEVHSACSKKCGVRAFDRKFFFSVQSVRFAGRSLLSEASTTFSNCTETVLFLVA